jgi:flavodoxin
MRRRVIAGVVIALIVVVAVSSIAALFLDFSSYTATGSQTLSSSGVSVGHALVVYDPGLSGASQKAAQMIAGDLQEKGYTVDLAGVRSSAASNPSSYGVVVAGGPMYFGKATSSIEGFLRTLASGRQVKLGVFVTTGSSQFVNSDFVSLQQQVKSATSDQATVGMVLTGNETQGCANLVSDLLK